jgi:hypothetical protein
MRLPRVEIMVPVDRWHDIVGNPMLADAILDRIVHMPMHEPSA